MPITCPRCNEPRVPEPAPESRRVECPSCRAALEAVPFRALHERLGSPSGAGSAAAALPAESGEATCFFCEGQVATDTCESCGRFLCDRCKVDWAGHVTCLTCVHANREIRDSDLFRSRRVLYDNLALLVLLLPLLIPVYGIFFSVVLSPVALYLAVRHWKASRGIVPRGRGRLIAVVVIAGLLLAAGVIGVGALFHL